MEINLNLCPLPADLIFEIFTRVSLQTLQQWRLILPKKWKQRTYETSFMQQHCQRTNTVMGFYINLSRRDTSVFVRHGESNPDESLTLNFLPEKVTIKAVSNQGGLVFCRSQRYYRFYVCKPTTKEWKRISNPETGSYPITYAMAVLHSPDSTKFHYKIIRFSLLGTRGVSYPMCEVYDSENDYWALLDDLEFCGYRSSPVYCNGAFHWLSCDKKQIFSFDIDTQKSKLIPVPEELLNDGVSPFRRLSSLEIKLVQLEGELAILLRKDYCQTEIWVMENYVQGNWKLREVVNTNDNLLLDLYTSETAVYLEMMSELIWYNFRTGTCKATNVGQCDTYDEFHRFESDYEPVFTST